MTNTNEKSERQCISIILSRTFFMRSGIGIDVAFNREFYLNVRRAIKFERDQREVNTCPFWSQNDTTFGKNFYPLQKKISSGILTDNLMHRRLLEPANDVRFRFRVAALEKAINFTDRNYGCGCYCRRRCRMNRGRSNTSFGIGNEIAPLLFRCHLLRRWSTF